jgi:hypothetical protein
MRNAEEFSGQWPGLARFRPAHRQAGGGAAGRPGSGRIRYAHTGSLQRDEPFCTVGQAAAARRESDTGPAASVAGENLGGEDLSGAAWPPVFTPASRRTDLWVLVCGGVAAAAAFAAAFVASGGVASHPATPETGVPAVVSQACPAPGPSPAP